MSTQRYVFEPFGDVAGALAGGPVRIMPVGKFYRGERVLDISPDRLKAIAANFKSGLPRHRVPVNEDHAGIGKIGTVTDVEYAEDGADGPGLYARYELTDAGKKLIGEGRYDATSPELIWTLNDGATYQDPRTGEYHDNLLVALAMTATPYFGHDNVALFSANPPEAEKMTAQVDRLTAELGEARTQADKFRADLEAERKGRRRDQLVERFGALLAFPEKAETLADTILKIETERPELAETVMGWIETVDAALIHAGLFSQYGSSRSESPADSFEALVEQIHREKFNSDPEKYSDALELAGKQRPDLARAYIGH